MIRIERIRQVGEKNFPEEKPLGDYIIKVKVGECIIEFIAPKSVDNKKTAIRFTKKFCRFLQNWEDDKCQPTESNSFGQFV